MPQFQVDDPANQTEARPEWPDHGVYTAVLDDIRDRTHNRRDGTGTITFLDWFFTVTDAQPDTLIGKKVRGSTLAVLRTNGGDLDRKFHEWASNILGFELPPGQPLDTDDLIGLTVQVEVVLEPDYKDPAKKWPRVQRVLGEDGATQGNQDPPF